MKPANNRHHHAVNGMAHAARVDQARGEYRALVEIVNQQDRVESIVCLHVAKFIRRLEGLSMTDIVSPEYASQLEAVIEQFNKGGKIPNMLPPMDMYTRFRC